MFFKSIRFKITILYMTMLALTLSSFSIVLYHNVKGGLHSNMEALLKSRAGGISQAIDAYWEASKFEAMESGVGHEVLRKRRNINFAIFAERWVKEESDDPKLVDIIVRIFDTDGVIITSSKEPKKETKGIVEISRKNFISVLQGKSRFDTVSSESPGAKITFRVFTTPVFENEKVAYIVQVASPLAYIKTALNNLKVALFVLFPITVFTTGLVGAFLAKVTLHPVDNMIRTIHQITVENMKLKLSVPGTRDEIQKLAETFNDMLERLEGAFTSQRRLFEDLSHELKTPLTILKGEFEVILKKVRSQEEYETILSSALEEIDRLSKLAENLLLLARLDSKEALPEKKRLKLDSLLQDVVNNIKGLAELKEIRLSFYSRNGISLDGDEDQLKALFLNILDNAIKYTPEKGEVRVTAEKRRSFAKIKIEDTGMGIPKEYMPHIFDRFYRVDKSRDRLGFGLGLSIAKSIAEAHNGTIEVESKPYKGTTFAVLLPT